MLYIILIVHFTWSRNERFKKKRISDNISTNFGIVIYPISYLISVNRIHSQNTFCIYCKRPLLNNQLSQKQTHSDCEKGIQKWINENKEKKIFIKESVPEHYIVYFTAPYCEIISAEDYEEKVLTIQNRIFILVRFLYCQIMNYYQINIRKSKRYSFRTVF